MIKLCERCFAPIGPDEPLVRLAHIDHARRDGSIKWRHSFLHAGRCDDRLAPRPAHERPDTGDWDRRRGLSVSAERQVARELDPTRPGYISR